MDRIVILDFGGQYAHLIANRVRRLGVFSEIMPAETSADQLNHIKGIILSGGPQSVYDKNGPQMDPKIFELGLPVLGICYGHQLMMHTLEGRVESAKTKEYGAATLQIEKAEGIFQGFKESKTPIWMSHGDTVTKLPEGFEKIGQTGDCEFAAVADFKRNFYGVQFHVEVTHTERGMDMLGNFLDITGAKKGWDLDRFLAREIEMIKAQVGDRKVFMLVSGGVDSTVAYVLLQKALGKDRVYGLFIDTGFLRKNERKNVERVLKEAGFSLHTEDASEDFFRALSGVTAPEEKRKIIGEEFLKVHARVAQNLTLDAKHWMLGQGTIYPDTIESGATRFADKIKTHHNRVSAIEELMKKGLVVEPLKELYKDEVRAVGEKLGLPKELVWRHPFPGPGLAVRTLCMSQSDRGPDNIPDEKEVSKNIAAYLVPKKLRGTILPIKSVGVQGDARTYRHPLALSGEFPGWDELGAISTHLTNNFPAINRVLWLCHPGELTDTSPSLLRVVSATLTQDRITFLQEADHAVMEFLEEHNLMQHIWQFPVVLLPLIIGPRPVSARPENTQESLVLRPVNSEEAMTANFYPMPYKFLLELVERLSKSPAPSAIFYDITNKPPGTIEWE